MKEEQEWLSLRFAKTFKTARPTKQRKNWEVCLR